MKFNKRQLELEMTAGITDMVFSDKRMRQVMNSDRWGNGLSTIDVYGDIISVAKQAVFVEIREYRKLEMAPDCLYEMSEAIADLLVRHYANGDSWDLKAVSDLAVKIIKDGSAL
jgi:hypothetical protein